MEEKIIVSTKPLARARSLTLPEMGPSRLHLKKTTMLMLSPYPVSCLAHHDTQQRHVLAAMRLDYTTAGVTATCDP